MKINWKEIWDANPDIFVVSGWEECPEEKRKGWHLPAHFSYFSSGDMNLRVGIIACQGEYKEEEFLLEGIIWGSRLGNGAKTLIYFVARDFSPIFLGAIAKLGGSLTAKAVYWREKLTPSLYPVQEKNYYQASFALDPGELRASWDWWERQLNPVATNHLKIIRTYFEGLAKRRVRTVFEKNKILFSWGRIEIAEVKKKGNKFELSTKVKWTRNKIIASKFLKTGWVDYSGKLNDEFCRAITGILELLENMEANGSLDPKDLLTLKLINDREFITNYFGQYFEYPWLPKERSDIPDLNNYYFFATDNILNVLYPVLDKPLVRFVRSLLVFTYLEYTGLAQKGLPGKPEIKWNNKIYLLSNLPYRDELRLCQSWLKQAEEFPIFILPDDWKTEGFKKLKGLTQRQAFVLTP
ncbi:MAG TPA: hypothetical protein GXX46_12455 [Peptococcaceae bacterium]|nr:hypothetical protein [Peptococcaceae bacterium]